jgi:hypothetical protein
VLANADTSNPAGSFIQFDSSVFGLPRTIAPQTGLVIGNGTEPIEISGPGSALLTVSGRGPSSNFSVFAVDHTYPAIANVRMSGLSITKGNNFAYGGGVVNAGNLSLTDVSVYGNNASLGGGIFNETEASVTLINVTLSGNNASGGDGIYNDGTVTLHSVTLTGNSASAGSSGGGGIVNSGAATLTNVTLSKNRPITAGASTTMALRR